MTFSGSFLQLAVAVARLGSPSHRAHEPGQNPRHTHTHTHRHTDTQTHRHTHTHTHTHTYTHTHTHRHTHTHTHTHRHTDREREIYIYIYTLQVRGVDQTACPHAQWTFSLGHHPLARARPLLENQQSSVIRRPHTRAHMRLELLRDSWQQLRRAAMRKSSVHKTGAGFSTSRGRVPKTSLNPGKP